MKVEFANAAREPEIGNLADCLVAMGARIEGIGTDRLTVEGVRTLHGATHAINDIVAMDAAGDFVIAWDNYTTGNANFGATAQRYNAAGVAQGSQFSVSTASTGIQSQPSVAMDSAGDFVLAWDYNDQHGNLGVAAERYNSSGVAQGSQFLVTSPLGTPLTQPAVAMDSAGDFVS